MSEVSTTHYDFFISYTSSHGTWVQWIAAQLEDAGYTTIIQAWEEISENRKPSASS